MRSTHGDASRGNARASSRTLSAILIDAVNVVRQDVGEYGFIALIGAFATGFTALVLRSLGGHVALSLILPIVGAGALVTMAASAAAVRRVEDNLEPDAARAFLDVLVRAPFLAIPFAPALVLSGVATFLAVRFDGDIGRWPATGIVLALVVLALMNAFQRSVFVPAIFVRGTSVREAAAHSRAVQRAAAPAIALAWAMVLAPTAVLALAGIVAGFGTVSTGLTTFVFVGSMPLAAAVMSLLYAEAAPGVVYASVAATAGSARGAEGSARGAPERLGRR